MDLGPKKHTSLIEVLGGTKSMYMYYRVISQIQGKSHNTEAITSLVKSSLGKPLTIVKRTHIIKNPYYLLDNASYW